VSSSWTGKVTVSFPQGFCLPNSTSATARPAPCPPKNTASTAAAWSIHGITTASGCQDHGELAVAPGKRGDEFVLVIVQVEVRAVRTFAIVTDFGIAEEQHHIGGIDIRESRLFGVAPGGEVTDRVIADRSATSETADFVERDIDLARPCRRAARTLDDRFDSGGADDGDLAGRFRVDRQQCALVLQQHNGFCCHALPA
jgi:hypothetical protein